MRLRNIALVHDAILEDGGAEAVVMKLLEIFPGADFYTSLINTRTKSYRKIRGRLKKSLFKFKFIVRNPSFLKPFINLYWESLDFSKYDLVISSSGSFSSKSIITSPDTIHLCYCHTPPHYLYKEYAEENNNKILKPIKDLLFYFLRGYDFVSAQRADFLIANSKTVAGRIEKYYRRSAKVVYPPVKIKKVKLFGKRKNIYLYLGRLSRQKGLRVLVKAFNKLGKRLVIVGTGPEMNYLKKIAHLNISFLGYVTEEAKARLLMEARGFINPSIDEDFGIAPVEAMSFGTPVIALRSGGLRETVVEGKTGIFFDSLTSASLSKAVKRFETLKFSPEMCRRQAENFSEQNFEINIRKVVKDIQARL